MASDEPDSPAPVATSWWRPRWVALLLLVALTALRIVDPAPIDGARVRFFDLYQELQPRHVDQRPVVIVDIDDASLAELGQWPWSRDVMARLISTIAAHGASVIGIDILFSERDRLSPQSLVRNLPGLDVATRRRLAALPSNDAVLAESFRRAPVVMGIAVRPGGPALDTAVDLPATPVILRGDPTPFVPAYAGLLRSIDELTDVAAGRGIVSLDLERDGVLRRLPLLSRVGETLRPAFALEVLRVRLGEDLLTVDADVAGVSGVGVGRLSVPTDQRGRLWINFSRHDSGRFVSAAAVLRDAVAPERFADKIVLIGTTSTGLLDIAATPVGASMAGVEIHAQAVENILSGEALHRPANFAGALELLAAIAIGLLLVICQPLLKARWSILLFLTLVSGTLAASWFSYAELRLLLDATYPVATALLIFLTLLSSALIGEERRRQALALNAALRDRARQVELRQLQAELQNAARESAMGQLSSAIAHELNQPLTSIMVYADAARNALKRQDDPSSGAVGDTLRQISGDAERATGIIQGLRELVDEGEVSRHAEDVNAVVMEAAELALSDPTARGVAFVGDLADDLPPAPLNRIQIQQVVVNLIRNAVQAMEGAPVRRVTLATAATPDGAIEIAVGDTGSGLDDALKERLFEPFVTTKSKGLGLGLAICRSIIEAHDGRLWATDAPGGGTEFRFTLPAGGVSGP